MKRSGVVGRSYKEKESADPVIKKLTKTTFDEPTTGTFNFTDTFKLRREKKWNPEIESTVKPKLGASTNPGLVATSKLEIGAKSKTEVGAEAFSGTYIDIDEINVPERAPHGGLRDSLDSGVTLRDSSDRLKRTRKNLDAAETTSVSSSFIELQQVEATGQRTSFVSIKSEGESSLVVPKIVITAATLSKSVDSTYDYPASLAGSSGDTTFQPGVTMASAFELRQTGSATRGHERPEMMSTAAIGRRSPVAVIPDRTLQLTPNSVASTSARMVGGRNIDPNNFGNRLDQTMRKEMIRSAEEASPYEGDVVLQSTWADNLIKESTNPEKQRCMPLKCLTFWVVCMMLVAGITAVSIIFKRDSAGQLGSVFPDPVAYDECPPSFISLGETLNFTCTIDTNHALRNHLKPETDDIVLIDPENHAVDIKFSRSYKDNIFTLYVQSGPKITCRGQGNYTLHLKRDNTTVFDDNVLISIRAGTVRTVTEQKVNKNVTYIDCPGTERTRFVFRCTLEKDCGNYHVDTFGSGYGRETIFNHKMSCANTYNGIDGSKTVCNTTFTEAEVTNHPMLGCRFRDTITQNTQTGYLQLPTCKPFENCTNTNSLWTFNCTKGSDHLEKIHNGTCDYKRVVQCFPPHRPIFRYEKVSFHDGYNDCNRTDLTVPVCRLG
ncbi:hypothetical protein DPMN_132447, partial [Dreissena polymorpha]